MKIILALVLCCSLGFLAPNVHAQVAKKKSRIRHSSIMKSSSSSTSLPGTSSLGTMNNGVPISSAGAEVSGVTGSAPGDPYNLAHPYFNGDPRWSDDQQLYMHGDFPWAMVSKNPGAFSFNSSTGKWEVSSTATLGKTK